MANQQNTTGMCPIAESDVYKALFQAFEILSLELYEICNKLTSCLPLCQIRITNVKNK